MSDNPNLDAETAAKLITLMQTAFERAIADEIRHNGPIAYNEEGRRRLGRAMDLAVYGYRLDVGDTTETMRAERIAPSLTLTILDDEL